MALIRYFPAKLLQYALMSNYANISGAKFWKNGFHWWQNLSVLQCIRYQRWVPVFIGALFSSKVRCRRVCVATLWGCGDEALIWERWAWTSWVWSLIIADCKRVLSNRFWIRAVQTREQIFKRYFIFLCITNSSTRPRYHETKWWNRNKGNHSSTRAAYEMGRGQWRTLRFMVKLVCGCISFGL